MSAKRNVLLLLCLTVTSTVFAVEAPTAKLSDTAAKKRSKAIQRGVEFLSRVQDEDGAFKRELGPAVTALATTAMLRSGIPEQDPRIAKALRYLEEFIQEDGGIYRPEFAYRNYETCVAIMCFVEVEAPRFAKHVERAQEFVKSIQWNPDLSDPAYGGAGYGKHKRPDLSNTTFLVEALKASGLDEDDPAMKRALVFISRTQNLESEHNTTPHSNKVGDGGFYYTPAAGGSSQAGVTENQGLRSYGSMTYAGLKSMIFAGVDKNDRRVKAATEWISKNYDLSKNPGMNPKFDGLFYYYHTFGKALHALGEDHITDAQGIEHDWRAELIDELSKRQKDNGAWVNDSERWLEGNAELVTAYALLSLSYCD